jgi:hypothetical protein
MPGTERLAGLGGCVAVDREVHFFFLPSSAWRLPDGCSVVLGRKAAITWNRHLDNQRSGRFWMVIPRFGGIQRGIHNKNLLVAPQVLLYKALPVGVSSSLSPVGDV